METSLRAAATPDRAGWQGHLHLVFGLQQTKTCVLQAQAQAPLKVQRPFYPEGDRVCHSVIVHTAGGMVGGDRLAVDLTVQPMAQALITTAAASKIYRSNGATAQQHIRLAIAPQAWLEWLPQETIVFAGAEYAQTLHVDLAPNSVWLGWEITRFGRTARGEQFTQGNWRSHTEVWQAGQPLWLDRQWLPGNATVWHSPHGLFGCPVVGSFAFLGQSVSPELVQQARDRWNEIQATQTPSPLDEIGVSRLRSGLICRYRGHSSALARRWFIAVWHLLRRQYGDRPACPPRVWQ